MPRVAIVLGLVDAACAPDVDYGPTPGGEDIAMTQTLEIASVPAADLLPPPPDLATESSWCWMLVSEHDALGLHVAGMDSGSVQEHGRYDAVDLDGWGLAYTGDALVFGADDRWHELDLATGTLRAGVTQVSEANDAVAAVGFLDGLALGEPSVGLLALTGFRDTIGLFESFERLDAGAPRLHLGATAYPRFQVAGTSLYAAEGGQIEVIDLESLQMSRRISLDDALGPTRGLGVAGGLVHRLSDVADGTLARIVRFDELGATVSQTVLPFAAGTVTGLWCDAPR